MCIRDRPSEHPTNLSHQQKPPYDVPVHEVEVLRNTPLYEILKQDILAVNSYHHQAVKDVAPSLAVSAKATDGIVEGVYRPDKKFIAAVQWHPEFSYQKDQKQKDLFAAFVQACK